MPCVVATCYSSITLSFTLRHMLCVMAITWRHDQLLACLVPLYCLPPALVLPGVRYDRRTGRSEPHWETVWSRVSLNLAWERQLQSEEEEMQLYASWKYNRCVAMDGHSWLNLGMMFFFVSQQCCSTAD
jgi:hypothetical protein